MTGFQMAVTPMVSVSRIALKQTDLPEVMKHFFFDLFTKPSVVCPDTKLHFLELRNSDNVFGVNRVIIRSCYDAMTPDIRKEVTASTGCRLAVTGTPGIGKTVYGILLLRTFVREQNFAVLYWGGLHVYYFSWKNQDKARFGLKVLMKDGDRELCFGYWKPEDASGDLWSTRDVVVIHDPAEDCTEVGKSATHIYRSIFVLSYGHALITYWNDKPETRPEPYRYLPLWTPTESTNAFHLWQRNAASDGFLRFGGCIRGWLYPTMWQCLVDKAKEVVRNHGDDVLGRTTDKRGSIVHLEVEFDASQQHHSFSEFTYIFGSERILEIVDDEILHRGDAELDSRKWI